MRGSLKSLLGEDIPNPMREWLEVKINAVKEEPNYGSNAMVVLEALKEKSEERIGLKELTEKTKLPNEQVVNGLMLLSQMGLIYQSNETYTLTENLKKHADLIK